LSGAHFNPAVSIAFALRRKLPWPIAGLYIAAQVAGAIAGVRAAHLMFELPLWQLSITVRTGPGQWLAEAVATFGLLLTIFGCVARTPAAVPYAVGLYITSFSQRKKSDNSRPRTGALPCGLMPTCPSTCHAVAAPGPMPVARSAARPAMPPGWRAAPGSSPARHQIANERLYDIERLDGPGIDRGAGPAGSPAEPGRAP
jgi:hypothetical protein